MDILEQIKSTNVATFNFKNSNPTSFGIIAEEAPEAVRVTYNFKNSSDNGTSTTNITNITNIDFNSVQIGYTWASQQWTR